MKGKVCQTGATVVTLLLLTCTAPVRAQSDTDHIFVQYLSNGSWVAEPGFENGIDVGSNISVFSPHSTGPYRIFTTSPSVDDIGTITFDGNVILFLGTGHSSLNPGQPMPTACAHNIAAVFNDSGSLQLEGRVTGTLGQVDVYSISRLDADIMNSTITHNSGQLSYVGARILSGSIAAHGSVDTISVSGTSALMSGSLTSDGSINRILIAGALSGSIRSVNSSISQVTVTNGDIGSVGAPSQIQAGTSVGIVQASSHAVNANIIAGTSITSVLGQTIAGSISSGTYIGTIYASSSVSATISAGSSITTISGPPDGSGNPTQLPTLSGSIQAASLSNDNGNTSLWVGTLGADVTLSHNLGKLFRVDNGLAAGRTVKIGDFFGTSGSIQLPTLGLAGQVIVNANVVNGGLWQGAVHADGTTLSPIPNYSNTSSSIGGGSVGQAPFDLHDSDCTPPNGTSNFSGYTVYLSHYGPVTWAANTMPVQILMVPRDGGQTLDITSYSSVAHTSNPRVVEVFINPTAEYDSVDYVITPVRSGASMLKCVNVDGGNVPVAVYTYTVHAN